MESFGRMIVGRRKELKMSQKRKTASPSPFGTWMTFSIGSDDRNGCLTALPAQRVRL